MQTMNSYKIDLTSMQTDVSVYNYVLNSSFFEALDSSEITGGELNVELTVKKMNSAFEFLFHIVGEISIPCDRCLDEMKLPVDTKEVLKVKWGEEYDETDDMLTLPETEHTVDVSWYIYEFAVLSVPITHVHDEGECNSDMIAKLQQHAAILPEEDEDE